MLLFGVSLAPFGVNVSFGSLRLVKIQRIEAAALNLTIYVDMRLESNLSRARPRRHWHRIKGFGKHSEKLFPH